jgi:hypothetical protein
MRKISLLFAFFISLCSFAQLKGTIKDKDGNPVSFATVIVDKTQNGTISNEKGQYELTLRQSGTYTIVYQFLGFKTERIVVDFQGQSIERNILLTEEDFQLDNIVINVGKNPADEIIRKAIKNKSQNTAGLAAFKADFYSKGLIKTLKLPKILMKNVKVNDGDLKDTGIDSLGRGIVYLSETVSEIQYQKPDKLKEHIVASKVSGSDNGYSFNTADESFYDFYENFIDIGEIGTKLVSPIANQAFSYYRYNLEATFQDGDAVINKIKVTPKVKTQPVFSGDLYLVEETGAIYGMDLKVTGSSLQEPIIEEININQNFFYDDEIKSWVKRSQNLDLTFGVFGAKVQGVFLSVFNNYNFVPEFSKQTFGKEVLSFAKDANKKDSLFWDSNRMFALTDEEIHDYHFKDSIKTVKQSPEYLDSIRRKGNKFDFFSPVSGYRYTSPKRNFTFAYDGLISLDKIGFNTVQGFYMGSGLEAVFSNKDKKTATTFRVNFDYGFASERFRSYGYVSHYFAGVNKSFVYVTGGTQIKQFHPSNIDERLNAVFSLLARKNYAKYYNNEEVYAGYSGRFLDESLVLNTTIGYEQRKPLFNNANGSLYSGSRSYTSNDPLQPDNFISSPIDLHHIYKFKLSADIYLGQKYISYPDQKIYMRNPDYPKIQLYYEKGFAASEDNYNYDLIAVKLNQTLNVSNKGQLAYAVKTGHYFNEKNISFIDRKHF